MLTSKGFSFIELLIVVAIIGILTLMSYPYFGSYVKRVKLMDQISKMQHWLFQQKEAVSLDTLSESAWIKDIYNEQKNHGAPSSVGANQNHICLSDQEFYSIVTSYYHATPSPSANFAQLSRLGYSTDIISSLKVSGYSKQQTNAQYGSSCKASQSKTPVYFILLELQRSFLSSPFSRSWYSVEEGLNIIMITGGEKKFYDSKGNLVRHTDGSSEMTCAILSSGGYNGSSKNIDKIAVPAHCRTVLINNNNPMNEGLSSPMLFVPL